MSDNKLVKSLVDAADTMSSEQPEVETQEASPVTTNSQTDITQQATSPTPRPHIKNPKRQAAGKRTAERTRIAREQQKKALAEAEAIIAKNNARAAASPPEPALTTEKKNGGLSVNQWIGIGGLVVSAAGLFLKRGEIMGAVKKNLPSPPPPEPAPAPPVEPAPKRKELRKMG